MIRKQTLVSFVITFICLTGIVVFAAPHLKPSPLSSGGYTGVTNLGSGAGCAGCHGGVGAIAVTVAIAGPTSLFPGQPGTYSITASSTDAGARVGLDVKSSDGTLAGAAGEPTNIVGGELTHNTGLGALKTISSNSAAYGFTWTMPAAAAIASTHTIAGCMAVRYTGNWAHASNATVTAVRPGNPTGLASGTITSASVALSWSGTAPTSAYRLLRKTGAFPSGPTDGTATIVYEGSGTSTTATGLAASTTYFFAVYGKASFSATDTYSSAASQVSASTTAAVATTWYVNVGTGLDTNPGTSASPFKTIKKGLSIAVNGDTVSVAAGTYNVAAGEVFPVTVPSGVQLISASGAPSTTVIDASAANPRTRVMQNSGNSVTTLVQGFTITGGQFTGPLDGSNTTGGGILSTSGDKTTYARNIITNNKGVGPDAVPGNITAGGNVYGGAVYADGLSTPKFLSNVFSFNSAKGGRGADYFGVVGATGGSGGSAQGGAIVAFGAATIVNNTFDGNDATGGPGGSAPLGTGGNGNNGSAAAVYAPGGAAFTNNIVSNNVNVAGAAGSGGGSPTPGSNSGGPTSLSGSPTYNLYFGNTPTNPPADAVSHTLSVDPLFVSGTDFHLLNGSPAKAAGTAAGAPSTDLDGFARPNPPSIGAYEAHLQSGDANGDGQVTVSDVFYLINGLFAGGPGAVSGDANGDGNVTVADVFYLINYLFSGGPPPV